MSTSGGHVFNRPGGMEHGHRLRGAVAYGSDHLASDGVNISWTVRPSDDDDPDPESDPCHADASVIQAETALGVGPPAILPAGNVQIAWVDIYRPS